MLECLSPYRISSKAHGMAIEGHVNIWRPASQIGVKALGLHWRGRLLLAAEVYSDNGQLKGVRPLGGSIEFGETARDALKREFKEELGVEVIAHSDPIIMENLYIHEGSQGHEVVFIFDIFFPTGKLEFEESIEFQENNGSFCVARWYDIDKLDLIDGLELFPRGLKSLLLSRLPNP
jgi:NUDIX domain